MPDSQTRLLRRSKSDRILGGICGGLGAFFGISPFWFRVAFVIATIPGGLPGILPYLICWIVIPAEG